MMLKFVKEIFGLVAFFTGLMLIAAGLLYWFNGVLPTGKPLAAIGIWSVLYFFNATQERQLARLERNN